MNMGSSIIRMIALMVFFFLATSVFNMNIHTVNDNDEDLDLSPSSMSSSTSTSAATFSGTTHTRMGDLFDKKEDDEMLRRQQDDAKRSTPSSLTSSIKSSMSSCNLVFVLGMGRSGTSTLTGLLITSGIYNGGNQLKEASEYNEKGYFEDENVVNQNILLMDDQRIIETKPLKIPYNSTLSIDRIQNHTLDFAYGKSFMQSIQYNSKSTTIRADGPGSASGPGPGPGPVIVKDPRLSLTLGTWIHFLKEQELNSPAILFTHRHPIDVSSSLYRRDPNIISNQGLAMWIGYNQYSIQNSIDGNLCVVRTRYDDFMNHEKTLHEMRRVVQSLEEDCGVIPAFPAASLTPGHVEGFVDDNLRHIFEKPEQLKNIDECMMDDYGLDIYRDAALVDQNVHNGIFFTAMKIYCDIESGIAFKRDYEWPEVNKMKRVEKKKQEVIAAVATS